MLFTAKKTIKNYASGGNILLVATIAALIVANIPLLGSHYFALWERPVSLIIGNFNLFSHHGVPMSLMQFINDALMAVFFFTIGLEIKREVLIGELSSIRQAILPIIAAVGGMIMPVAVFYAMGHDTDYMGGAAIPMATDIAFSLGILAMLGSRVPVSLKVFLTTLAVVDDIGGILVIAIFYSASIDYLLLVYAAVLLLLLVLGTVFRIQSKIYYLVLGAGVWFLFLNSGIHPTIAGVLVAFCIPATPVYQPRRFIEVIRDRIGKFPVRDDANLDKKTLLSREQLDWFKEMESASDKVISPLQELEDSLHPVVNYIIIPLFAFANAGIVFQGMSATAIYSGVGLAIICGLLVGKFTGIFLFSWLAIKAKVAFMPEGCNWKMIAGVSLLGGIGFTVSLFIANLSFGAGSLVSLLNDAKLGIIVGSLLSGIAGYTYLSWVLRSKQ